MFQFILLFMIAPAVGHFVHRRHNDINCSIVEIHGAQGPIKIDRCNSEVLYIGRSDNYMVRFQPRNFIKNVLLSCCVLYCEILDNHTHSVFSEPESPTCASKYEYRKKDNEFHLCYQHQGVLYLTTFYNRLHHYSVTLFLDDVLKLLKVI
jgi:hypothetical protein